MRPLEHDVVSYSGLNSTCFCRLNRRSDAAQPRWSPTPALAAKCGLRAHRASGMEFHCHLSLACRARYYIDLFCDVLAVSWGSLDSHGHVLTFSPSSPPPSTRHLHLGMPDHQHKLWRLDQVLARKGGSCRCPEHVYRSRGKRGDRNRATGMNCQITVFCLAWDIA